MVRRGMHFKLIQHQIHIEIFKFFDFITLYICPI